MKSEKSIFSFSHQEKKVLFVLGVLWGENGITTHLLTLAKGLQKSGWEVGLATKIANNSPQALQQSQRALHLFQTNGIQCYQVDFVDPNLNFKNMVGALKSLYQLDTIISDYKPSIIHIHSLSISPYIYLLQRWHHFPYVATCHMEPKSHVSSVKFGLKFKYITNAVMGQEIIAISEVLKDYFVNVMGIPLDKVKLINHGIDESYFYPPSLLERSEARTKWKLKENQKVICIIGRLASDKGHKLLMESVAKLYSEGVEITVLVAGQGYGMEQQEIIEIADQLGIRKSIYLIGYCDPRQVLWASDALVLPSQPQTEAFPLVIPEAMLCGVVPIRTPGAGATDQIEDSVNGYIIPFEDSNKLAMRLKELFENEIQLSRISSAAIERARNKFTLSQMITKTIETYTSLMY